MQSSSSNFSYTNSDDGVCKEYLYAHVLRTDEKHGLYFRPKCQKIKCYANLPCLNVNAVEQGVRNVLYNIYCTWMVTPANPLVAVVGIRGFFTLKDCVGRL